MARRRLSLGSIPLRCVAWEFEGEKQHLPGEARPHFAENWPGLAFSSFRLRSRGISCRLMPWLLALQGWDGGLMRGEKGHHCFAPGSPRVRGRGRLRDPPVRSRSFVFQLALTLAAGRAVSGWAC
jgi:hypothetical protein